MKKSLLIGMVLSFYGLSAFAQIEVDTIPGDGFSFDALIVEKIPVPASAAANDDSLTENHICYRLFVDMKADNRFITCGGVDTENPPLDLFIQSTEYFYNNITIGSDKGQSANPALFAAFPSLEYDSYVSDGRIGSSYIGVLREVDSKGYIGITPETTPAGEVVIPVPMLILMNNKDTLVKDYASGWGIPGGSVGPDPDHNTVFIGQFTTAGEFKMKLNFNFRNPYGDLRLAKGVVYGFDSSPDITFMNPKEGTYLKTASEILIDVRAEDFDGQVDSVQFFVNDAYIGTDRVADGLSFKTTWNQVVAGDHEAKVIAYDNELNASSDSVNFTVGDPVAPVVTFIAPADEDNITKGTTVTIQINATDADGTVEEIALYIDDQKVNDAATYNWTPTETGTIEIKATAKDNDDLTTTEIISVLVQAPVSVDPDKGPQQKLHAYPNPVQSILHIDLAEAFADHPCQLRLFDITGKEVLARALTNTSALETVNIDFTYLQKGIYIIRISNNQGSVNTLKISKN